MGNFAGYYSLGLSGPGARGAILRLRLRADGVFAGGLITPIMLVEPGMPLLDPARTGISLLNSLSRTEFGASAVRITPAGRILAPPGSGSGPRAGPPAAQVTALRKERRNASRLQAPASAGRRVLSRRSWP